MPMAKCSCNIGYVNADCPFSYSNGWHSRRDAMLLQVSAKLLKKVALLTDKQREELEKDLDADYIMRES